jgi:predicted dienelactone hydrolase
MAFTLAFALLLAIAPPSSHASTDCDARPSAGYRVLSLESGRKVAVWYPTAEAELPLAYSRTNYGFLGSVAQDSPPLEGCPRAPLVLFSHGLGGCALQSLFITEELARHGYVVAAPDHTDAACAIGSDDVRLGNIRTDSSFLTPGRWTDQSEIDRLQDLREAIRLVANDPQLARIVDVSRVGAVGHSLGGYTVVGMAGGWPAWKTPEIKAVLALSPYVEPFVVQGTLAELDVPVMFQGAQFDWGITPSLEGRRGAYAASGSPKYFVKLKGGSHFEWTNLLCTGESNVGDCLKDRANAALIDAYGIAFLDRYLKGKPAPELDSEGASLNRYQHAP